MTKSIKQTGQEKIMEEFKKQKQNIYITRGEDVHDDEFLDIKGYSLNGPYLCVQLHDDTQYVYPMASIVALKLTVSE